MGVGAHALTGLRYRPRVPIPTPMARIPMPPATHAHHGTPGVAGAFVSGGATGGFGGGGFGGFGGGGVTSG